MENKWYSNNLWAAKNSIWFNEEADRLIESKSSSIITTQTDIYIKTKNIVEPQFNEKGKFFWPIRWETNGVNGWIVQKIENIFMITDCIGNSLTIYNSPLLKTFWEAWQVKDGQVLDGDIPGTDVWGQGEIGMEILKTQINTGYKGTWMIKGSVYFEKAIDTVKQWKRNPDLSNLYYTSNNTEFNSKIKLYREASGTVYVCGADNKKWYHRKLTIK